MPRTGDRTGSGPGATRARTVHAAGGVLWRAGGDGTGGVEVAVVHRPHHGDWSLPKGKVDPGETRAQAAVREIAEETGFASTLSRHLATVRYHVGDAPKEVDFWNAVAGAGTFVPGGETDELRWLAPPEASALLTYDTDREVLAEFVACPPRLATVVLVRHAKAGQRGGFDGPDAQRPLTAEGRAQAERIGALLGSFGVGALHAAERVRCEQTLLPASTRLGVGVAPEPAFGDDAVEADPGAAVARLAALAAGSPVPAICAQGDGIPTLVRRLAQGRTVRSNRRLDDPPCRKGSLWVLSFLDLGPGGSGLLELVAADYYRDATF